MPGEDEPLTDGWTIKDRFDHELDAVIDAGECGTEPTTVVDFSAGIPGGHALRGRAIRRPFE